MSVLDLDIHSFGGSLLTVFSTPAASNPYTAVFTISWIQLWRDGWAIVIVQQHIVTSPTA